MKKPELKEVAEWMGDQQEALLFYNYYESINWKVGKNPMKVWKSAASGWLQRNKQKQSKVEKAVSNQGKEVIDLFWVRMSQIYGTKWVSNYGEKPTQPWINLITNMPHEKIAHGLNEIIKEGEDWPASLAKFNRMCQSYRKPLKALNTPGRKAITLQRERTAGARQTALTKIKSITG